MQSLAEIIQRRCGAEKLLYFGGDSNRCFDPPVVLGIPNRLRALGWLPLVSLEDGIDEVIKEWRTKLESSNV